jgi:hypothetical protein
LIKAFLSLETRSLTAVFWGATGLISLAFLLCPYPPMIDYPQHVAMGAVIHDLIIGSDTARSLYQTNLLTYNAGIEVSIALLSFAMRPELAGRVILAAHVLVFAVACLAVLSYARRPRWYALLFVPLFYNHITGWGFSNFVIGLPVAVITIVLWMKLLDGVRGRPTICATVVLSMLVAYTHVLVMLCICVGVAVATLERCLSRGEEPFVSRVRALLVPAAVLAPSVGYSLVAWFYARATSTTVWEHAWAEGQDDPLWSKLRYLLRNAVGNFADDSDQLAAMVALLIGATLWFDGSPGGSHPRMRRLALTFFALYAVVPKVFIATFHIYQRFLPLAALFAIAALPHARVALTRWLVPAACLLALVGSVNILHKFLTIPEVDDAMAIIDDEPPRKSLLGVTFQATSPSFIREIWVHLPALYQVRRQGVLAYSFLRNESVPVHYRPGLEPPRPPGGFEWNGQLYDVHENYARAYDLVLVLSWETASGGIVDPSAAVFKGVAPLAKLIARRGRFFLYDLTDVNRVLGAEGGTEGGEGMQPP